MTLPRTLRSKAPGTLFLLAVVADCGAQDGERINLEGRYEVTIYRVHEERVLIVRVVHGAQLLNLPGKKPGDDD
ncbi:MAG: hypothetical protein AABZ30_01580 [Myxococcota bacterium]